MESIRSGLERIHLSAEVQEIVEQLIEQAESEQIVIGLFGSFSVGKSALLNRILDRVDLLPTHTNETTAVITTLTYGDEDRIQLIYSDGHVENTTRDHLHTLVAGGNVTGIEKIAVTLSQPQWLKQVSFIDTPGRNTKFAAHIEASKQAIIDADAAVYVLPWQGLTMEDIVYLQDLLIYQPNLYFILNKVDQIDESQGQTIEDVRAHVEREITNQLGRKFPVYAMSAKTGYHLSSFITEFIPQITENMKQLKQKRFTHSISELITRHTRSIENEMNLLQLANEQDEQGFQDQKRKIEMEQTKLNDYVKKELAHYKDILADVQSDIYRFIEATLQKEIQEMKRKILSKFTQDTEGLNPMVENYLLTARNQIYQRFEEKLDEALRDKNQYKLSELENSTVNIQFQEPSFEELQVRYQERLQGLLSQYEEKKNRLQFMLNETSASGLDSEIADLQQMVAQLEDQMREEYVPQYVTDQNFDENKAEKIAKHIGTAGDLALSVALAIATSGISAGAQIAGKVGAEVAKNGGEMIVKQAGETVTKQVVTQAAKESVEQAAKAAGKQVAKEVVKQGGKETLKKAGLESLKVIGNFVSPVETAATAIGRAIDSSRQAEVVLDKEHQTKFFLKKQQIESKFQKKKSELNQLKEQQKSNVGIVRNIEFKLEQMERKHQEEVKAIEESFKRDQQQFYKTKFEDSIAEQLELLHNNEQNKYKSWVKLELDKVLLMLENTLPSYYHSEWTNLMQKMASVEAEFTQNKSSLAERLDALKQELHACHEMKQGITNGC